MTAAPGELDLAQARLLLEMAEAALRYAPGRVVLPDGWDVIQSFAADGGGAAHGRGFYAAGSPGGTGTRVAVLALALPWGEYLDWTLNPRGVVKLGPLPAGVAAAAPAGAQFQAVLAAAYAQLRKPIWKHLKSALDEGKGTLLITAKNLAGPLAHLAALDLRPGNKGPADEAGPGAKVPCWTFSSPPAGNDALKTYAKDTGGDVTNVWAGGESLPIDLFPTAPAAAEGYALPGTLSRVATPLPESDDPWTERGGPFYLKVLGGTPEGLPSPAKLVEPLPAGFDRTLAHSLAKRCTIAYRRRQRPADIIDGVTDLASGGVRWCALFGATGAAEVVVAFRGTVTADELARVTADSDGADATFIPTTPRVHGGALRLYTAPASGTSGTPSFRDELIRWLKANLNGRPLYLAGHDLGGTLAALAALDLRINAPDVKVTKVYTYGSTPVGDYLFAKQYAAAKLDGDSYRVARDVDFARTLRLFYAYEALPAPVMLQGAPENDDATRHSLASYVALLDPSRPQSAGADEPPDPDGENE